MKPLPASLRLKFYCAGTGAKFTATLQTDPINGLPQAYGEQPATRLLGAVQYKGALFALVTIANSVGAPIMGDIPRFVERVDTSVTPIFTPGQADNYLKTNGVNEPFDLILKDAGVPIWAQYLGHVNASGVIVDSSFANYCFRPIAKGRSTYTLPNGIIVTGVEGDDYPDLSMAPLTTRHAWLATGRRNALWVAKHDRQMYLCQAWSAASETQYCAHPGVELGISNLIKVSADRLANNEPHVMVPIQEAAMMYALNQDTVEYVALIDTYADALVVEDPAPNPNQEVTYPLFDSESWFRSLNATEWLEWIFAAAILGTTLFLLFKKRD